MIALAAALALAVLLALVRARRSRHPDGELRGETHTLVSLDARRLRQARRFGSLGTASAPDGHGEGDR